MTSQTDTDRSPLSLIAIVLIVGVCLSLLGATGYVKYKLDHAESALVAPNEAFSPEQDIYEKTIVALGYSGFLGSAQTFMNNRDRAALADMRMNLKTAQETIARLAEKAPAATRRDMKAITDIYESLITKADETDAMSNGLTNADLLTAATALSALESRLHAGAARQRMAAHDTLKQWSLLLMLAAWGSIALAGIAALFAAQAFASRYSAPVRNLTQCVENILSGTDQAPVWGLERRDAIGDLARALERARIAFTQMPDVTVEGLDGEEKAVRMKFDGQQRALFQSMMKTVSDHFEAVQMRTGGFTSMMTAQQDALLSVATRLSTALDAFREKSADNADTIANLTGALCAAAQDLNLTQEKSVETLGKLVPSMQERIHNMAEVTQLAGQQIATSLQSLIKAEGALRGSANQSQQAVQQLSGATNQMGERMFAALNLVQASGKLLGDTTAIVKDRFHEAVDALGRGEGHLKDIIARAENRLASTINAEENMAALASRTETSAIKMERAVAAIAERHDGLSEQVVTATHRMEAIVASFDAAARAMGNATTQVRRDAGLINSLLAELRANNDQLLSSINQNSQTSFNAAQGLAEKSHALMQRLEIQIQQQAQSAETHIADLTTHSQTMVQHASATNAGLAQAIASLKSEQEKLVSTRTKFSETLADLGQRFEQQATTTFAKTENWAAQSFAKLNGIAEQVDSVMQRLGMLGQLTGTLGTVAGQLGQLVPTLTQWQPSAAGIGAGTEGAIVTVDMEDTKALIVRQTEDMVKELQNHWHTAVVQIEAMHDQLAQLVIQQKDQLETRLVVLDKKLRDATDTMQGVTSASDEADVASEEKKEEIINELISAISKINEHVIELDETIEEAGLKKGA